MSLPLRRRRRRLLALLPALLPTPLLAAPASAPATGAPVAYQNITWAHLTPMGWDPLKRFRDMKLDRLSDLSPRTQALMDEMREAFDNAPLVNTLDGAAVRLAGYVVPLQGDAQGLREFLLVPYFGACIHTPPPPANQIIHVHLGQPTRGLRAMDPVWASGRLHVDRQPSDMGMSGYRLDAAVAQPYPGAH
ncbi:MAG: DUF3299 domain-containing protein [Roseateles depolymerans]|uniref:DUF3299 domain-containing protein n=1 Tax=Roseateles depolymerans TaxID=76731 RepID=A0A2W5E0D6_9BURK|nr:MAG: DUF3299 domain-containing protein [Roseateles depolymerans]